jgi:acyl transferase domain-containing protein/NAD(P)-dependent dehydrogenase (short-subunit alcohol dehydrogenase family)/acyl carrier protein
MENTSYRAIAIVGVGAVLPDAPNVPTFWENIKSGRYSVSEVDPKRWDPALYFDENHAAPDKTYSKIGGWVREFTWDPIKWHLPIPPKVADAMDGGQKWAIGCTREVLEDYGYPKRSLNPDRTAVILGNAMAGERHYLTALRIYLPEFERELSLADSFAALPEEVRKEITRKLHERIAKDLPEVTEDSMPGELSNCIAGRLANLFNFHGPNYVCDAACASAMAAMSSAIEGLVEEDFDAAITGGIDRNMGASTFVKFCKIGALSATGTRPYADGADGFVMGEGAALFLMKRLADAERDGDKIYAVVRGIGGSSDGKGKGITAPNPLGQRFAIARAWQNAGLSPATATYIEGHGTSTRVGDQVEVQSMAEVLSPYHLPTHTVALGSVKSNFGHLKGAAGAAGLLKTALALHNKVLPPSLHCEHPSPEIDFARSPLYVNTELTSWTVPPEGVRRAGLSAFGFGGTNFHAVLEEYIPRRLSGNGNDNCPKSVPVPTSKAVPVSAPSTTTPVSPGACAVPSANSCKPPLRGALVIGGASSAELTERLRAIEKDARAGNAPGPTAPSEEDLRAPERVAIDYADAAELATKAASALKALTANQTAIWKALRPQGIFRGSGSPPKVAFLYPGQGSQYVNMLKPLRDREPVVADTFAEADRVMTPLLGRPLSEFIFVDKTDVDAVAKAEAALTQTAVTQPAVLACDLALTRLLAAYGIEPEVTIGHSLGEYGALVASGGIPFADALEAVSARGREMTRFALSDNGRMAAVFAPLEEVERLLKDVKGYVVIANFNSEHQSVIGGASQAVEQAMQLFQGAGYEVAALPVSHAFHTSIVAPASDPLRKVLERLHLQPPRIPIVANTNGKFYPTGAAAVPKMRDILAQQVASPVQFVTGLRTLYEAGARLVVEVGPKKALQGFAEDVLGPKGDVISVFTNHPKVGDIPAFNQALCCLYAAGLGRGVLAEPVRTESPVAPTQVVRKGTGGNLRPEEGTAAIHPKVWPSAANGDHYVELGKMFADVLERGWQIAHPEERIGKPKPVTITGAALGLPGTEHTFDDESVGRLLRGEQFIHSIPERFRQAILDKHITRVVKSNDGSGSFENLTGLADVIKLAGRGGKFDLEREFGISSERCAALDRVTQLAIAVGLEAMRDAGIPLVMRYKTTSKGTQLPDRWMLPESLRDDSGVIFASAFPGLDSFADDMSRYYADHSRRKQLVDLQSLRAALNEANGDSMIAAELDRRIEELCDEIEKIPYAFDRRFLFRVLPMGHSQFAEFIGARGPNTAVNAACASTTQAVGLAEDWIRAGRCRRVVVVSADDITSDHLIEWMGAGFLASGAAATDDVVEEAAVPFDKRRHGMIIGMGAAGLVIESAEAARERGIQPICEVLSAVTANSAFHGTRLDVQHIGQVMEHLVAKAEACSGIDRHQIAPRTVFVSHETYTPARGGSAAAEIHALRKVFGDTADKIVIANTKGFTGHAMGAGVEDVLAVKALETGIVPPIANFKEVDPDLGTLNLSKGGVYPVEYALRLGAGFGSQISMTLIRWVTTQNGIHQPPNALGYAYRIADSRAWREWLSRLTGSHSADLEVNHRTLRVRDQGLVSKAAESAPQSQPAVSPVSQTKAVSVKVVAPVAKPASVSGAAILSEKSKPVAVVKEAAATPANIETETIPAPAAAPPIKSPTAKDRSRDSVKELILALVVEKTGYPRDMLDLDLDLEADLGVDTVKQAEIFAAIRETYNIPRDEDRKLRDYPTLAHVIRFVHEKRLDLANPIAAVNEPAVAPVPSAAKELIPSRPTEPATSSTSASLSPDEVKERILALVVEKTGYPKDMLELDQDLEADLGVDTVKQAEIFAAIREIYNIPRDENRKLRDYPTISHVIRFVLEKRADLVRPSDFEAPDLTQPSVSQAPSTARPEERSAEARELVASTATPSVSPDEVKERILALVVEKTGYPKDMLDLDLDLEADLGVDTVKQAEIFAAIREIYNVPRDENRKLRDYPSLGHVVRFVFEQRPDLGVTAQSVAPLEPAGEGGSSPITKAAPAPKQASVIGDDNVDGDPTGAADLIKNQVLEIVAGKTGYPKDMLDLDLDLEADLGIDTVKQAEMFAAVRTAYDIPRDENLKLRDFPTLAHVIKFALDRSGLLASRPAQEPAKEVAGAVSPVSIDSAPKVPRPALLSLDVTSKVPRRVPVPVLRPPLSMCKPTGASLERGHRVVVMPDKSGVAGALTQVLKDRGAEVLRIEGAPDAETLDSLLKSWIAAGPIHGVYWLPALDNEGVISEMDFASWREALRVRIKSLYVTMRALYDEIAKPGAFYVSATCLGGQHGYDEAGAVAPLGGAIVGFAKTYKRERPESVVKSVDLEPGRKPEEVAELLLQETLRDPGVVEIGYKDGLRWTVGLQEQPASDGRPGLDLDENSVFLITGAAGSIVSAITADLAAASGGTFYLLDLAPKPDPDNPDLKRFVNDKENLKRELFARIQARGERATPALVEKELAALERAQAGQSAIDAVKAAGGTAHYFSVNLTDGEAVADIINQIRERHGRIDVLLHAAGVDFSRPLSEKEPREFDLVFDVKSDGFFNLLHAISGMPLKASVSFSSIAGRFGNPGQTDYSSGNDLLCKITSSLRTTHPKTRGIVIDWTAWGGIGMASRRSIPKVMEMAGIEMLSPEAGVPVVRRELTAGGTRGEVIIAQKLGVLMKEWDECGGVDPFWKPSVTQGPMIGKIVSGGIFAPLTIETTLDPTVQPFLYDHQIDGIPVLPGVMGIEAFAEAALVMCPGWQVEALEDVNFLAPFKFYRNKPRTLAVEVVIYPAGNSVVADCKLTGRRSLPNQNEPQVTTYVTARVRLTKEQPKAITISKPGGLEGNNVNSADIYRLYFHGPAYRVVAKAWWDGHRIVGLMAKDLPNNHHPALLASVIAPRLIELCFQTAGVWEMGIRSRMGLPLHIDRISNFGAAESLGDRLYATVTPNSESGTFDAEIGDAEGTCYLRINGYQTVALPGGIDLQQLKPLQTAMSLEPVAA